MTENIARQRKQWLSEATAKSCTGIVVSGTVSELQAVTIVSRNPSFLNKSNNKKLTATEGKYSTEIP